MRQLFIWNALVILLVAAVLRITQLHTYPPGPHYDEAVKLLAVRSIAFDGANLFPIMNSYQGRESLFFYLNAPLFQLIADDILIVRFSSVYVNLITIAASMALGRLMFKGRRGLVIGLIVGALMTISFHQLFMSRQAYRAVTLPMMQALALLFLWRGLRRSASVWLMLGGVFAGGALYTYMASRLFPLWLGLAGLALLWLDRRHFRQRLGQGVIFFGAMLVTALPMIIYAVNNPDIFFQRLTEVSDGEVSVTLAESIRRHAEMFFIRGDFGNLRYNIPGRPYFTAPEGVLLLIGVFVLAWRLWRGRDALERSASFLILLAPLMVIPSVISLGGYPPSHMRSLGMVPLIFLMVAVGFEYVYRSLLPHNGLIISTLVIAIVCIGGILVFTAYFEWAQRADLFYQADGDLAEAVKWLPAHTDEDTLVYIGAYHREHPTVLSGWDKPVTWLGTDSLFLPPDDREAVLIFAHDTPPQPEWAQILAPARLEDVPAGPDGGPAFWAYRINDSSSLLEDTSSSLRNPYLALMTVETPPIIAGSTGEVVTVWQVLQTPPYSRLRPVLDMKNEAGITLSSSDLFLMGTDRWLSGETIFYRMRVTVPHGTPPGEYPLFVTWIDRDTETYLSYAGEGITAQVGTVEVIKPAEFPTPDVLPIQTVNLVDMAQGVRLLGWDFAGGRVRPGEVLRPVLYWQALAQPDDGLSMQVVLRGANDTLIFEGEHDYPVTRWEMGELVTQYMRWPVPRNQPNGTYEVILKAGGQEISMGQVMVDGVPRVFDAPQPESVSHLIYDRFITLYGYTINYDEDDLNLQLVWQALQQMDENYTVFVHLVDEQGVTVDQRDAMPQANAYPTSLWVSGEYIVDEYNFVDIPSGDYTLRIGLYLQANGQRLVIHSDNSEDREYAEIHVTIK